MEAMRLQTRAGKVAPVTENGHTRLIDVPYFRVDRFRLDAHGKGALPDNTTDGGRFNDRVQILFVAEGETTLFADGNPEQPLHLGRCKTAIVPANADPWDLVTSHGAEVIRIVPQAGQ